MKRDVKKNILSIGIAGTLAMLPTLSHAQDTLRACMISFEYGEGGAIVKENVITDEGKSREDNAEKQRQTQQKKSLGMIPDSHLSVGTGSDAGILKVNLPNYTDYSQRTLTVYHLSGIQQTSLTLNDAFSTIDLRHLPRGTYVAVLTLDGERETKKFVLP